MSTTIFCNNLQRHLFRYADWVEHSNSLGLSNEAVDAEGLFCTFLNRLLDGSSLMQTNKKIRKHLT
jgi:hypothetical protein